MFEGPIAILAAVLLALPTLYLLLISTYLFVLCVGAWLYRPPVNHAAPPCTFALLIPAHNEESHLPGLMSSAGALNYPPGKFRLFIVADNCTDATAALARAAGVEVLERHDLERRGKGPALDWALRTHAEALAGYDAIALVDADMHIHPDFLRHLSASISVPGVEVVQSLNTVANPDTNWRTALGFVGFSVINYLRPCGRCWLGGTGELRGSGMAFRSEVLLKYGWPAHSLAEDVEFSKLLLLDGIRVHFNPRALVTSEIPTHTAQVKVQQQRWEKGKLDLLKRYLPVLTKRLFRRPSICNLDALLDLLVPPQSVLVLMYLLAIALSLLVHPFWTGLLLACLAADALCIVSALLMARAPLKVWLYLAAVPLLLLKKLPFYLKMLLTRHEGGWQRTPRNKEVQ